MQVGKKNGKRKEVSKYRKRSVEGKKKNMEIHGFEEEEKVKRLEIKEEKFAQNLSLLTPIYLTALLSKMTCVIKNFNMN